jgi:hypothetical protein
MTSTQIAPKDQAAELTISMLGELLNREAVQQVSVRQTKG